MFSASTRFWMAFCGVLLSILVAARGANAGSSLRPSAQPGPEHEPAILLDFLGKAIDNPELESLPPEEFSLGDFVTVHLATSDFWQDTAPGDLGDEIVPAGEWAVPVLHNGDVVAAAVLAGGSYTVSSTEDQDFGESLTNLTPTDKLLHVMENGAWYIVAADIVTALNDDAAYLLSDPVSLTQFQEILFEQWLVVSNDPPGFLRGGGQEEALQASGTPRQSESGLLLASRLILGGFVGLLIGALIVLLLVARRQSYS